MPSEGIEPTGPTSPLPAIGNGRFKLASKLGEEPAPDANTPSPSQDKKAMPYFMPTVAPLKKKRGAKTENDEVPDYIDKDSIRAAEGAYEVKIDEGTRDLDVQKAQTLAFASQLTFYTTLDGEHRIIADLAELGGNRTALEELYFELRETDTEPERMDAAMRFLQQVETQAKFHLSAPQSGTTAKMHKQRMASQRWDEISASYTDYTDSMLKWEEAADTRRGRMAVDLGPP